MTLYSRLVGVTDGLGVPSTLTWNGSSSTAPEMPAGVEITYAATGATIWSSQCPARGHRNHAMTRQLSDAGNFAPANPGDR